MGGVGLWGRGGLVAEATSVDSDLLIDGGAVLTGASLSMRFVPEILELYVKVMRTEHVAEAEKGLGGIGEATGVDEVAHFAVTASGEADDSLSMGA
jgi:hypothetical protein